MDSQSLFSKPQKEEKQNSSTHIMSLAISNAVEDNVLGFDLGNNKKIDFKMGTHKDVLNWVKQGSVNYALISSSNYASLNGSWKIIPQICMANIGASNTNLLFFNKDLPEFKTIIVSETNTTALLVLKILLRELYQLEPKFILKEGNYHLNADITYLFTPRVTTSPRKNN